MVPRVRDTKGIGCVRSGGVCSKLWCLRGAVRSAHLWETACTHSA